jgi:hypothetical protein
MKPMSSNERRERAQKQRDWHMLAMQSEAPKESPDEAAKEAPAAPTALTMALLDAHNDALRALSLSDLGTLHVLVVEDDVGQQALLRCATRQPRFPMRSNT